MSKMARVNRLEKGIYNKAQTGKVRALCINK